MTHRIQDYVEGSHTVDVGASLAGGMPLGRTPEFKQYRRRQIAELRPCVPDCDRALARDGLISVSAEDQKAGSPKIGDMIARNPKNHDDQWLVAEAYFKDNFAPL